MAKHMKFYKHQFINKCESMFLKSPREIWEELEKVRSKYKHRKLLSNKFDIDKEFNKMQTVCTIIYEDPK